MRCYEADPKQARATITRGFLQFLPRDAIIGSVALEPVPAACL